MPPLPLHEVDLGQLKALAHPLRQRLLYHLAFVGPATSTSVAQALGESTGSTSYHLRQLARYGLIEEIRDRANGRERWWRLVPLDLRGPGKSAEQSPELEAAAAELGRIRLERDRELVDRFLRWRSEFQELADAAMFSSSAMRLTHDELRELGERYVELLKSYWRPPEESPEDAKPVAAIFYAFPWPGEP
jgi:predicted ArsR family transcriptional regulator